MNALFICNQNKHRSKTAAEIFKDKFDTKSAGIYENIVTSKDLNWSDLVIVMEDHQREFIAQNFPKEYMQIRILCLEIPDVYKYMQPQLLKILNEKMDEIYELV
jgi:predicted protein tyrosine phosphatase